MTPEPNTRCRPRELKAALAALDGAPIRVAARDWPGALVGLENPGLYSWWVDAPGASELEGGLGLPLDAGRIYGGQAGATRWPSGNGPVTTLAGRLGGNHLNGSVRGST